VGIRSSNVPTTSVREKLATPPTHQNATLRSQRYDQSAVIGVQNTMAARNKSSNHYDARSGRITIGNKSVTPRTSPPRPLASYPYDASSVGNSDRCNTPGYDASVDARPQTVPYDASAGKLESPLQTSYPTNWVATLRPERGIVVQNTMAALNKSLNPTMADPDELRSELNP